MVGNDSTKLSKIFMMGRNVPKLQKCVGHLYWARQPNIFLINVFRLIIRNIHNQCFKLSIVNHGSLV